jgi:eukaryotic-like serine/threonine-protein kinase
VPFASGSKIGAYDVVAWLGAGGMGEVYRARDPKLNRDVALKVLPDVLTHDPDRVARLRREAQVLASINHPNIGGIYGLEDTGRIVALVLELVDGPTLAELVAGAGSTTQSAGLEARRASGLAREDALAIAAQIADALDAAHAQGIVHRDLKPANVKVRPDGTVKVLDFGLAKALDSSPSSAVLSASPTVAPIAKTASGTLTGTAAYMSPEQARGQAVDKRTDIWAFGCVLFEMLTGTPAFHGENLADVMVNVLRGAPEWSALPDDAAGLRPVLERCVEKDVRRRFRDIGDVKLLLEEPSRPRTADAPAPTAPRSVWRVMTAMVVGALVGGAAVAVLNRQGERLVAPRAARFELASTSDPVTAVTYGRNVVLSPDGSRIVYTSSRAGVPQLMMRRIDQLTAEPVAGSQGGFDPFFSPDGEQIGFATFTSLKKVAVDGGPGVTICAVDAYFSGATWLADNTIVFAQRSLGLFRVSALGGKPERLAVPDQAKQEQAFVRPVALPGGGTILYTLVLTDLTERIAARRLDGNIATTVVADGFGPEYVTPGFIVYGRADRLMAVRFNVSTGQAEGAPVVVQEGAFTKAQEGIANFSAAADGTGVFVSGRADSQLSGLSWFDRTGRRVADATPPDLDYPRNLRLSPDGGRVALTLGPAGNGQIWIYDVRASAQPVKVTFEGHNLFPLWYPDGRRIVFMQRAGSATHLVSISTDGNATEPQLVTSSNSVGFPAGWSSDGAFLVVNGNQPSKIVALRLGDGTSAQWLQTPFTEFAARVSPDGHWVAYQSDQTGTPEVWVRPFPGPGSPVRVSSHGGARPMWAGDGKEIFFESGAAALSAAEIVATSPAFQASAPQVLFEGGFSRDDTDPNIRFLDVAPDGRILAVTRPAGGRPATVAVVQHWDEIMKGALPAGSR